MSVVTHTILSEGQPMDPKHQLLSIDISKEVNRISDAQLMLLDGSVAKGKFLLSDTPFFEPGREIEIKLRYEGQDPDTTVFKGLVVRHGVEANAQGSTLTIELKDAAVKMTHPRKSEVFRDKTDDAIIGDMIAKHGLEKGTLTTTEPQHAQIMQYYCSDWDFMVSRAEVQNLMVVVDDGEISLQPIAIAGDAKHRFEYGISEIYNFDIEADITDQTSAVQSIAWDIENHEMTPASKAKAFDLQQGNLDADKVAQILGFDTDTLSHPVPVHPKELQSWADARMARSRMSMIRGRIEIPGLADIRPLDVIEIAGAGERFNGKTLVTGVRHRVNDRGWSTDLQFGLSSKWFSRKVNTQETPAAGLLPAVSGLQIGVVAQFEEDPEKQYRVKVNLSGMNQGQATVWARQVLTDAGPERGIFFRPETGDEVVVGFLNDDPRHAVILGAMHSAKNAPPSDFAELTEENIHKGIVTRQGTTIGFTDKEKASVLIQTPEGNKILFDDDTKTIQILDQHDNSITLNKDGIEMISKKDVKIDASGNVEIKGKKVDVK